MSNLEYLGKTAAKTFKQIEQEQLVKDMVLPASELAKQKQEEIDRANAFTRASLDESFYARTEKSVSPDCPTPIGQRGGIVTREPFKEQP